MIRVLAIPYLNTAPFVYGLKQEPIANQIDLAFATPAVAAFQLHHNSCDIAIVPVAAVPSLPYYKIVGNHCIGAVSAVASVLLCCHIPVEQIKEVALDQESRTSVLLAKLLLHDYWHITPRYVPLPSDFPTHLPYSVVLIGDKALLHSAQYPYIYDLAEHWIAHTGKPFVFAAWVANKPLSSDFEALFDRSLAFGVAHIDKAIESHADNRFTKEFAKEYLTKNISFSLDDQKRAGLEFFWSLVQMSALASLNYL
ncbi:MAG: menaquinone biosynthesis protein [Prevotellaceae bacterium]|jgi:chorismate dehydratase|nr:menaquinone biosynthesis protein [Prevotellaceae bacterium]